MPLSTWHIVTSEYPPHSGGVSDYTAQLAPALEAAGQPVRVWCREFGGFAPQDLQRVGRELDCQPTPRRLLLQWVPHGYGYRSMNVGFCRWIANRPEPLEIMVHEPGLGFGEGGLRHNAAAAVHRLMTGLLLRRAEYVWISIPAWEARLRPYTLGRKVPFTWLPVPSNIPVSVTSSQPVHALGYFGQYDERSQTVLLEVLDQLLTPVLLIGRGAERVRHKNALVAGDLPPARLSEAIQSCQTMFHYYPDGVSSRRGTIMASLAHGMAAVANEGRSTEPVWRRSGAIALASDAAGMVIRIRQLSADPEEREKLRQAAIRLYEEKFALHNTVRTLMACRR